MSESKLSDDVAKAFAKLKAVTAYLPSKADADWLIEHVDIAEQKVRKLLARYQAEHKQFMSDMRIAAERIAAQSELLSKKAEK